MPDDEGRRLAAIMFTDVAGYTSLSQKDEALALQLLDEHRSKIRPILTRHNVREIKTVGDAFLVEFGSALEATQVRIRHPAVDARNELRSHTG
jgi:adenylate cyclase